MLPGNTFHAHEIFGLVGSLRSCSWLLIAALFLFLPGCATKLPQTLPIKETEQQQVFNEFKGFQEHPCDTTVDADVVLELTSLGKTEKATGILLAREPSFIRYTATDPLGRSLLILVSDGTTFTLVNNREGKAFTGSADSKYFAKYVPKSVQLSAFFPWLAGRLENTPANFIPMGYDKDQSQSVWLKTKGTEEEHHILFDPDTQSLTRHIVTDRDQNILLDIGYKNYVRKESKCPWPMQITLESRELTGALTVNYQEIFFNSPLNPKLFQLSIPPHYKSEKVD